jgi:hypothetical protein
MAEKPHFKVFREIKRNLLRLQEAPGDGTAARLAAYAEPGRCQDKQPSRSFIGPSLEKLTERNRIYNQLKIAFDTISGIQAVTSAG